MPEARPFYMLWSPINRYMPTTVENDLTQATEKALTFCRDHGGAECFVLQAVKHVGIEGDPRKVVDLT